MDWYFDRDDRGALATLRHRFSEYLERHSIEGSDVDGAELLLSELVTNALRHTEGPIWVSVDWSRATPVLSVHDLGAGFTLEPRTPRADDETGRGLFIAAHLTDELRAANKRAGGMKVSATLPVRRAAEGGGSPAAPIDQSGLPLPDEADDGAFGKESFLRALVVQLAATVELTEGPAAAERLIGAVGAGVGARMEGAYRRENALDGPLDPGQMGDLYVRLKAAIEGDFYIVEANEDRIVLGNRRCPFGDAVRRTPSLCRMTSSVFGGIAARNTGGAAVQLEERIAVGDPECRVVVWLKEPPAETRDLAHFYSAP